MLVTVEEYRNLRDPPGFRLELHHGEVVQVPIPNFGHYMTQIGVSEILQRVNGKDGIAGIEFAFRPRPEHELWGADVAFVTKERYDAIDPEDNLAGSPEIVVEVLSPSNTAAEIMDKKTICLESG